MFLDFGVSPTFGLSETLFDFEAPSFLHEVLFDNGGNGTSTGLSKLFCDIVSCEVLLVSDSNAPLSDCRVSSVPRTLFLDCETPSALCVLPSISGVLLSFSGHHIQWTRGPGPIETQIGMHCRGGSRNFKRGWTYSDSGWQPAKLGVWGHAPWKDLHSELLHFMTFEVKHTQKIAPLSAVFSF